MTSNNKTTQSKPADKSMLHIMTPEDLSLKHEEKTVVSPVSASSCVRSLLQNWRQGTVGCKDRGEVAFSNKKPWKQKGTGRARAGTRRSPLWRKGGVIFGPQTRVKTLKVSKSLKRNVMAGLLWNNLEQGRVVSLDWMLENQVPKTALAYQALKSTDLHTKKIVIFTEVHDQAVHAAFANIPNVRLMLFDQPNAYTLLDAQAWVFLKKDSDSFKQMVGKWI
jgi:large subunit ribosomal protein L4